MAATLSLPITGGVVVPRPTASRTAAAGRAPSKTTRGRSSRTVRLKKTTADRAANGRTTRPMEDHRHDSTTSSPTVTNDAEEPRAWAPRPRRHQRSGGRPIPPHRGRRGRPAPHGIANGRGGAAGRAPSTGSPSRQPGTVRVERSAGRKRPRSARQTGGRRGRWKTIDTVRRRPPHRREPGVLLILGQGRTTAPTPPGFRRGAMLLIYGRFGR